MDFIRNKIPYNDILITINPAKIGSIIDKLKHYNFVDEQLEITEEGIFFYNLDISPTNALLLKEILTTEKGRKNAFGVIAFISIIECWSGYFLENFNDREKLQEIKDKWRSDNDMEVYLRILKSYLDIVGELSVSSTESPRGLFFLKKNLINQQRFSEMINKMRKIILILSERQIKIVKSKKTLLECIDIIRNILPKYYKQYQYNQIDNTISKYAPAFGKDKPIEVNVSINNYVNNRPEYIIPLGDLIININTATTGSQIKRVVGLSFA